MRRITRRRRVRVSSLPSPRWIGWAATGTENFNIMKFVCETTVSRWMSWSRRMGITFRARDLNLDSPVALKFIGPRHSDDEKARERFRREARAAAQLRHPNVASVFHFGETKSRRIFLYNGVGGG